MKTVNHVSAHVSPMSPVYTAKQKKVTCRRATPDLQANTNQDKLK